MLLLTDDGQHIQAHKIILSAESHFFGDIFFKSNHGNMLMYLKGISMAKLEPVIDFIYNGEAFITQEDIMMFIGTGKELEVKGLEGELTGVGENKSEKSVNQKQNNHGDGLESFDSETFPGKAVDNNDTISEIEEGNLQYKANNELSIQISEMIEKNEDSWICNKCGKSARTKRVLQRHVEIHIEGMSHSCHICNKTFLNRPGLNTHIYNIHSGLFSCDICGKTGMNRHAYRAHRNKNH